MSLKPVSLRCLMLSSLVALTALSSACATTGAHARASAKAPPAVKPADPGSATKAIAAGDQAFRQGNYDGALAEYVRALSLDARNATAYLRVAETHNTLGAFDTAAGAYRKVLLLQPDNADAIEGMGLVLLHQQHIAEARSQLMLALQKNPALWRSYNGLGVIADLSGSYPLAEAEYRKALSLKPNSVEVINNLGYSRYLAGRLAEAQAYFERALSIERDNARAWSNLALVYTRQGRYEQAVGAFRELMPEPQAYYSTGYVCMLAQRYAEAAELFQKAIELSPSYYADAHDNLERAQRQSSGVRIVPTAVSASEAVAPGRFVQ